MRVVNKYCHSPWEVADHFSKKCDKLNWWNYVTSLRGDDFSNTDLKLLFTCILRGDDIESANINDFLECFDKYNNNGFLNCKIVKMLSDPKYSHYLIHIEAGFNALSNYYNDLYNETGKERYRKCACVLTSVSEDFRYKYWTCLFKHLFNFVLLVSDSDCVRTTRRCC
jgi:hypothetical protein